MIHRLTENDRDVYIEMAREFYHSDAVLHPIPDEYFVRTVKKRSGRMPMQRYFCLSAAGDGWLRSDRKNLFPGSGRLCVVDRGGLYP